VAIMVCLHIAGMTPELYDLVADQVRPSLADAEGFVAHAARQTERGFAITEIWTSGEARRRWLEAHFELPGDAGLEVEEREVELRNVEVGPAGPAPAG
jgi:hypothetical protein